jgi:hypothetical protein
MQIFKILIKNKTLALLKCSRNLYRMINILSRKKIYPLNPPLKTGLRFSRNAEVPSRASSPAIQRANAFASRANPVSRSAFMPMLMTSLAALRDTFPFGCKGFCGFFHFIKKRFRSNHFVDHSVFLSCSGRDHIACKNHLPWPWLFRLIGQDAEYRRSLE